MYLSPASQGGTVLEMMKQHAITERRGAALGADVVTPVLVSRTRAFVLALVPRFLHMY